MLITLKTDSVSIPEIVNLNLTNATFLIHIYKYNAHTTWSIPSLRTRKPTLPLQPEQPSSPPRSFLPPFLFVSPDSLDSLRPPSAPASFSPVKGPRSAIGIKRPIHGEHFISC